MIKCQKGTAPAEKAGVSLFIGTDGLAELRKRLRKKEKFVDADEGAGNGPELPENTIFCGKRVLSGAYFGAYSVRGKARP